MPLVLRRTLMIGVPLALLIAYVGLTAQLTAQTYRLADDKATESQLSADEQRAARASR